MNSPLNGTVVKYNYDFFHNGRLCDTLGNILAKFSLAVTKSAVYYLFCHNSHWYETKHLMMGCIEPSKLSATMISCDITTLFSVPCATWEALSSSRYSSRSSSSSSVTMRAISAVQFGVVSTVLIGNWCWSEFITVDLSLHRASHVPRWPTCS